MAPINTLSVLAFATAALAVPYNHGHGHAKYHNNRPSGFSAYPIAANGTAAPYGTGLATGAPIAPASETSVVSDVETATEVLTSYADAPSSSECASEVTVTSTAKVTVTVTPEASSQGSSSEAAPVQSSSAAASSPAGYESAPASSSEASPAQTSSESSAPVYSQASSSSASSSEADAQQTSSKASFSAYSAPAKPTITYAAANKNLDFGINYGSPSSSSAAPSSSSAASYGNSGKSGKRGVAYNDAKLTDCLVSSPSVSWGYNWGSSSSGLSEDVEFIPMLWGPKSEFTDSWSDNAKDAIKSGSKTLFSFNEPDLGEQANLTPQQAADAYKQYMQPLASDDVKICAPSVTNGGGDKGLGWLSSFLEACSDCTIDCLNVHWYDSADNVEYFKKHVNDALDLADGKKPVYVSEFAATGSDDQISEFLETVMPWMDGQDNVAGYAYFMAGEGKLVSGSEQSAIGKTYAS